MREIKKNKTHAAVSVKSLKIAFRRATAALLVFVIFTAMLPEWVFANLVNPVTVLTLTPDDTDPASTLYRINMRWDRPPVNSSADSPDDNNTTKRAEAYDVYYRNATKSAVYPNQPNGPTVNSTSESVNQALTLNLDPGSLYVFKVEPYHIHTYRVNDTTVTRRSNVNTAIKPTQAIYLSDIQVSASGSGKSMTVTWSNPTMDGKDVFTAYKIYYTPLGDDPTKPMPSTPFVMVNVTDEGLIRTKDGNLQYTFVDTTLKPGIKYAVKVEPVYNGNEIRRNGSTTIIIDGNNYAISFKTFTFKEYRTNEAAINFPLAVKSESASQIRLTWDSFANTIQNIDRVEIRSSATPDFSSGTTLVGTLLSDAAKTLNYWVTDKPSFITYYKLYVYTTNSDVPIISDMAEFNPTLTDFLPYSPAVLDKSYKVPLEIALRWLAFEREPYTPEEAQNVNPNYNSKFIDMQVSYDIYVTDNASNFSSMTVNNAILSIPATSMTLENFNGKPSFASSITQYVTQVTDSGITTLQKVDLVDNKVYYIKIVATRTLNGQESSPAFDSIFIPPQKDIPLPPITISKPPLRVKTNNGVEEISQKSITVQWDRRWVEIFNNNDKSWYSFVGVASDGSLVYGSEAEKLTNESKKIYLNDPSYQTTSGNYDLAVVKAAFTAAGANADIVNGLGTDAYPLRFLDMQSDTLYEIHVATYDSMTQNGYAGYESYLAMLGRAGNEGMWTQITGTGEDPLHPEFPVTKVQAPTAGDLAPNTPYIIFFRPYAYRDGKKVSYYPNFIIATTKAQQGEIVITPTVPQFIGVSATDTTITIKWEYSSEFRYTLSYSDNIGDYPDKGTVILPDAIAKTGSVKTEGTKTYIYYVLTNMFPDTLYNIWGKSASTTESSWSNPLSMRTKDIETPVAPSGLGLAAKSHIDAYNKANNVSYTPSDAHYLIVECVKDPNDTYATLSANAQQQGGSGQPIDIPNLPSVAVIKFNNLLANKQYYFRVKEVYTVSRVNSGATGTTNVAAYNYVFQISADKEFNTYTEVATPPLVALTDLNQAYTKRKESAWSTVIILWTNTSTEDYDGDKDPKKYPLPLDDFEIIFDPATDTLGYRFRSVGTDATGAKDNLVDQRFITRLLADKTMDYKIDLTLYNNRSMANRVVEMPYSIYQALEERKINLHIIANNLTLTIKPGSLSTREVRELNGFGSGSTVKITLNEYTSDTPLLSYDQSYMSKPQKITVQVLTADRSITLANTAEYMSVSLKLDSRSAMTDRNLAVYAADKNTAGWERVQSVYDGTSGVMTVSTNKPANYSTIAINAPIALDADNSTDAMINFAAKFNIKDMPIYTPREIINANQFNQILAAVAMNKPSFSVNAPLGDEDYNALGKSKLLVPGTTVSREAGLAALVKLYEIKTKTPVKNFPTVEKSAFTDIASIAPEYQQSVLKAEKLGFLDLYEDDSLIQQIFGDTIFAPGKSVNPKKEMTLGEVLLAADIIIQDTK